MKDPLIIFSRYPKSLSEVKPLPTSLFLLFSSVFTVNRSVNYEGGEGEEGR